MKSTLKWLVGLYVVVAIITFMVRVPDRNAICTGIGGCGLSYSKGIVWSAIWPAYWTIQWGLLK
jgi:hypothetical protein